MSYPPQDPYGQQPAGGWPGQQPGPYGPPQQPPYGPPTQQFPGAYPDPGGEPPKKRTGLIIGVVVAVLVIAGAVGVTGFWKPGFFLAADEKDGGGTDASSTAPQVPGGSTAPGVPGGQTPPKPNIETPGGANTPVPGGGGAGDAAEISSKAQEAVDAFNARDKPALAATFCDPSKVGDFDMSSMPPDAKMTVAGQPKITGAKAAVPIEMSMGEQQMTDDMPLENPGTGWCVTND